jgi:hypothetical protein
LHGTESGRKDLIIDLTGSTLQVESSADSKSGPGGRGRDVRWVGVSVIATLAVVLAVANYVTGMRWREQALAAQEQAARAAADAATQQEAVLVASNERATAELRREAMAKQLAVSEADVAALEARVEALASDKARDEDRGRYEELSDSGATLHALQAQLDSCVVQVDALRVGLRAADGNASTWRAAANAAHVTCAQASADAAGLDALQ